MCVCVKIDIVILGHEFSIFYTFSIFVSLVLCDNCSTCEESCSGVIEVEVIFSTLISCDL